IRRPRCLLKPLGCRQHYRQPRGFRGAQARGAFAEVVLRGRLGAEHALAPFHAVQINLQDALLAQQLLQQQREYKFLPLAQQRAWALLSRAAALALRSQAFSMAFQSTPSWLTKPSSSEAITARLSWSEMLA